MSRRQSARDVADVSRFRFTWDIVWRGLTDPSHATERPRVGLFRLRSHRFDQRTASLVGFISLVTLGRHGLQRVAIDLAQRVAGQFVEYLSSTSRLSGTL